MKKVRIILEGTGRSDISDSDGRPHKHGHVVELSDADADLFVSLKCAVFLDGSSAIKAVEDNKERAAAHNIAMQKVISTAAMEVYDTLSPEARAAVQEGGDEIVENILAGGTVPIAPVTNESLDTSFDDMINDRDSSYPKKKRGKRR